MQFLWLRLPQRVARFWPSGAVTLSDGHYLLRWPAAAWTFAAMAIALGLATGRLHEGRTYVSSLLIMLFFAVIGQGGASLGMFAMIGWVIGDLVLNPYPHKVALPGQLLTYVLLGLLAVVLPLGVLMARRALVAVEALPRTVIPYVDPVVAAIAAGAGAYAWARALPVLIAPAYPSAGQVETFNALLFAGAVALAGALRSVLEWAALHGSEMKAQSQELWAVLSRQSRRGPVPGIPGLLLILFGAAGTASLLWGLTANLVEVFLVLMFFGALLFVRFYLLDGPARKVATLARVPLTVRLVIALVLAYFASRTVIQVFSHGNSRLPALVAVCLAALFLTLLTLPDPARRSQAGLDGEFWVKQEDDWKKAEGPGGEASKELGGDPEPETLGWEDSLGQLPAQPPGRTLGRAADPTELSAWNASPGRTADRSESAGWNEGTGRHVVAPWNETSETSSTGSSGRPKGRRETAGWDAGPGKHEAEDWDTGSGELDAGGWDAGSGELDAGGWEAGSGELDAGGRGSGKLEAGGWDAGSGRREAGGRDADSGRQKAGGWGAGSSRREAPAWNEPSGGHEAAGRDEGSGRRGIPAWNEPSGRHEAAGWAAEGTGRHDAAERREGKGRSSRREQAGWDQPSSRLPSRPVDEPFSETLSEPVREPLRRGRRVGRGEPVAEPPNAPSDAPASGPLGASSSTPVSEPVQQEAPGRGKRWGRGKQPKEKPPPKQKAPGRDKSSGQDEFLSWHESLKRDASAEGEVQDPWK